MGGSDSDSGHPADTFILRQASTSGQFHVKMENTLNVSYDLAYQ